MLKIEELISELIPQTTPQTHFLMKLTSEHYFFFNYSIWKCFVGHKTNKKTFTSENVIKSGKTPQNLCDLSHNPLSVYTQISLTVALLWVDLSNNPGLPLPSAFKQGLHI